MKPLRKRKTYLSHELCKLHLLMAGIGLILTLSSSCAVNPAITTVTTLQESEYEMKDSTLLKISFDTGTFYDRYLEALQQNRPILIVLSERPFCECFGEKEIMPGVTLNAYNASAVDLLKKANELSHDEVETILIDRYNLKKGQLDQYIELLDALGVKSSHAVAVVSKDGAVAYISGDKIELDDVLHALSLSENS